MIILGKANKGPMLAALDALLEETMFKSIPREKVRVIKMVLRGIDVANNDVNVTCRFEVIPELRRLQVTLQIDDHNPVVGGVS